ncbi:unnamed protein product [Colias eurytheme]|nr:unnamed protein product [Colias eurytheme]
MRAAVSTRHRCGARWAGVAARRLIGAAALTIIKICLVPLGSHLFPSPRLRDGFVSLGLLYGIASSPLTRLLARAGPVHLQSYCSLDLEFARFTLRCLFEISERALLPAL